MIWSIENRSKFTNESRNAIVLPMSREISINEKRAQARSRKKMSRKINTTTTTIRFIRFVAKISVLSRKLPALRNCLAANFV